MAQSEVEGLRALKSGFLYFTIADLITIAAYLITIAAGVPYPAVLFPALLLVSPKFTIVIGTAVVASILSTIAAAIMLYAGISMIRPGFRALANLDNRFKISYTGIILLIIGWVVLMIELLITTGSYIMIGRFVSKIGASSAGIAYGSLIPYNIRVLLHYIGVLIDSLVLVGVLIVFVGDILALVIGGIRLGSKYNEGLFTAAGILFILGVLGFISPLLMYIGLGRVLKRLSTQ